MIAFVRGTVVDITESTVILENGNIGYEIYMPSNVLGRDIRMGQDVKIHSYFHV